MSPWRGVFETTVCNSETPWNIKKNVWTVPPRHCCGHVLPWSPGLIVYLIINCITLFIKGIVGVNLSARFHSTSIIDVSLNRIPVCRLSVFALRRE